MANRDWWPFTRMIITAAALGAGVHFYLDWQVQPGPLLALAGQMFGVMSILAMISFALADVYLLAFLLPLYALAVLNDWFYQAAVWSLRIALRLRDGPALSLGGLCGEILLFGAMAFLLVRILS